MAVEWKSFFEDKVFTLSVKGYHADVRKRGPVGSNNWVVTAHMGTDRIVYTMTFTSSDAAKLHAEIKLVQRINADAEVLIQLAEEIAEL